MHPSPLNPADFESASRLRQGIQKRASDVISHRTFYRRTPEAAPLIPVAIDVDAIARNQRRFSSWKEIPLYLYID